MGEIEVDTDFMSGGEAGQGSAIKIGPKAVWMQEEVINEAAVAKARDAGLLVVMNKCMLKEHQRLTQEGRLD